MKRTLAVIGFVLYASTAFAQRNYVTHRNYTPPNGEDVQAFFARAYPGLPVADKPGYTWQHDGHGWYHEVAGTPLPGTPTTPKPPDPGCPPGPLNLYQRLVCDPPRARPVSPWTGQPFSYEVGGRYRMPYPNDQRLIVVAIDLDPESLRRIVTGRLFPGDGLGGEGPVVFYEDLAATWVPLEPGQLQ